LREARLLESHSALRVDLSALRQASYCAALIEQVTEAETPIANVFELFRGLLGQLPKQKTQPQAVFAFEIKLLDELGLAPNLSESSLTPGSRQILEQLAGKDWAGVFQLRPSAAQTVEIRQFLHGFLIYHLDKIPRGRNKALDSI
jgi:hypothetical protein